MFLLIFLLTLTGCAERSSPPTAVKGRLDLSTWNLTENGPVNLSGEWEFYWDKLLGPEEFSAAGQGNKPDFIKTPGFWTGRTANGLVLSARGYGTYRLRMRLPQDSDQLMSLLIFGAMSVSKVWINGIPMAATGVVGRDKASEKPVHHSARANFNPSGDTLDIIIQVSNHHNMQGGINRDIRLGTARQIDKILGVRWLSSAFLGGVLFCMSLYHFALFFMRRSARPNLYFGMFCLAWFVAIIFNPGSGFIADMANPKLPWAWYINLSLLPYGLIIPLLLVFYHSLFPKKSGRTVNILFSALGALFIGYILATKANAFDTVALTYFLVTRFAYFYLFCCFVLDIIRKEEGVWLLAPGYVALAYAEFDDILIDLNIISSPDYGALGVFIFVMAYSFFMSARFTQAFVRIDTLSTKLEAANVRLRQLNKLKDDFLANTTHELKTPLAGMVGISEALLAGAGGKLSSLARKHLRILVHSGNRLSNLVNDVLDLSRLEHSDITLRKNVVSPHDAAQRVLALSRQSAENKNLFLKSEISPDFPKVLADQDRLEQILLNLVGNGIKFTTKGGLVISAEVKDAMAEIAVTDTGIGIAPQDQGRIFSPHEQIDSKESQATGGAGLGLAITRHLVELHGGQIRVVSQPRRGSTFTFTLPLYDGPDIDQADPPEPEADALPHEFYPEPMPAAPDFDSLAGSAPGENYQVLVVDDEPVNLHVVASCLQSAGITFRTAGDGATALGMIENGDRPDMILLDVMMPGPDGYEVCRELRKKNAASAMPVIMLTIRNRIEDIVEGFAVGANDYLTKPFSRDELIARVTTQLKLKKAYGLLAENLALKTELDLRRKTEQGLRLTQMRLSKMLDSLDDAIIAVNQSREIGFCNTAFVELTGYPVNSLLGIPLSSLLKEPQGPETKAMLNSLSKETVRPDQATVFEQITLAHENGKSIAATFFVTGIELEEEPLVLIIVRQPDARDGLQAALASAAMLRELNKNRQRILNLEETMLSLESGNLEGQQAVLDDLKALDTLLENLGRHLTVSEPTGDKRGLAVTVMNLAVDCWSASTMTTKAELAEQSRTWNVYLEKDGYFRTQTLDKYLSEETLPARPRWRNIFITAEFVLANCDPDLPLYKELDETLAKLKTLA